MNPLTLVLDWYINPDQHADYGGRADRGAFKAQGLDVRDYPPSDPALPWHAVAARQADHGHHLPAAGALFC